MADRPGRPIRCRFSQYRTTRPGVPSFISACGVSAVGFGPKELSPTLARRSQLAIHPADLLDPCGSPAPRRHPGARRHGYSVVTVCIRLPTSNVKIVPWTWLRAVFSEVHVICRRRGGGGGGRGVAWRPARRIVGRSDFRGSLKFSSGCKSPERQKGDIVLLLPLLSRERVELRKE